MCYTPIRIRLYPYLAKDSMLFCDATGTIVFMKDPGKHPPVAFAELLLNEHSVVCCFFQNHERNIYVQKDLYNPKTCGH